MKKKDKSLAAAGMAASLLGSAAAADSGLERFEALVEARQGSEWNGPAELWLDPNGNEALTSNASLTFVADGFDYSWSYEGDPQEGTVLIADGALRWRDSWHQPENTELSLVRAHESLFAAEYAYAAGSGPDWHWRIRLSERPDETLVLQMTNIAPWGEEARAVRMLLTRVPDS